MGDRVLVTFTTNDNDYTPAIYLHWQGHKAAEMIREAQPLMRKNDPAYAAARFCGFCASQISGVLGLGIVPGPSAEVDWDEYSHGDAGVYVVNVETGEVQCHGGYGMGFQLDPANFSDA